MFEVKAQTRVAFPDPAFQRHGVKRPDLAGLSIYISISENKSLLHYCASDISDLEPPLTQLDNAALRHVCSFLGSLFGRWIDVGQRHIPFLQEFWDRLEASSTFHVYRLVHRQVRRICIVFASLTGLNRFNSLLRMESIDLKVWAR